MAAQPPLFNAYDVASSAALKIMQAPAIPLRHHHAGAAHALLDFRIWLRTTGRPLALEGQFLAFYLTLIGVIAYQCVGVALFLPFEIAFPKARLSVSQRAAGFIFLLATAPVTALVAALMAWLQPVLRIKPIPLHFTLHPILAAIFAALWVDLQFYALHRIQHRFFWRFHSVHHSIRNLSAANSYHHWSEAFMGLTIAIPLMFLDVQMGPTLGVLTFIFTYQQFYIHSASRPNFGGLRWLLVDNVYHRIHHSTDPAHYHRNFGAMTPLWDWLFGTLYMPSSDEWPDVGLCEHDEPAGLRDWHLLPWRSNGGRP